MDCAIGPHVGPRLNAIDPESVQQLPFVARRKLTQHVSAGRVHIGLIEGYPQAAKVSDCVCNLPGEAFEKPGRIRLEKCASLLKPSRMGEVMQTNDRLDASLVQSLQHLPVALQSGRIKTALLRLNAAPLQ